MGTLPGLNLPIIAAKSVVAALAHLVWGTDGRTARAAFKNVFVVVVVERVSWTSGMEEPKKEAASEQQPHPISLSPADPGNPAPAELTDPAPADPGTAALVDPGKAALADPGTAALADRPQCEGERTARDDEYPLQLPSAGPANFLPHFKHRKFFVLRVNTSAGFSAKKCVISVLTRTLYTRIVKWSLNICPNKWSAYIIHHCICHNYSILYYTSQDSRKFWVGEIQLPCLS